MDINQLTQLVQFVDEERRKDRAMIVQLQERVESLTRELDSRSRYNQSLETQIAELRLQVQKAMGWTNSVEQIRAEFGQVVERVEDQRTKAERESSRVRQIEIEALVRQLNELKKEVKPYSRHAEELDLRRQEEARLNDMIARVQAQVIEMGRHLEEPGTAIAYLEEQRRQDNKRVVAMEQELPDLRKRIEQFPPQLLMLDEAVRRRQTEIDEAAKLLEAQSQVIESQRVADIRRERQFAEYGEVVERVKERINDLQTQTTGFIQMREEVRRALAELPDVQARLEVRLNEVVELQRDAEGRARRQADEFRDMLEKEWKSFSVTQEEKWFERDRRIADYEPRIAGIEDELPTFMPQIMPLYDILEAFSKAYAAAGREWLTQANQLLDRAKMNFPSDTKLSRRQRRRQKSETESLKSSGSSVGGNGSAANNSDAEFDDDLVH
jgi:DNA repair exonuclease SbcCD ATPase subunit